MYDGNRTPLDLLCEQRKSPTTNFPERKSPTTGIKILFLKKKINSLNVNLAKLTF